MKANDVVKKFGIDAIVHDFSDYLAKENVGLIKFLTHKNKYIEVDGDYLKRLVESHRVVNACGGIHMARADVMDLDGFEKTSPYWMKIKQAIIDVESCQ